MNPPGMNPDLQADGSVPPGPEQGHAAQARPPGSGHPAGPGREPPASGRIRRGFVAGERAEPAVSRAVSLQSRTSSVMTAALMIAMGLGLLGWYYSRVITRHAHAHEQAPASAGRDDAQMNLPSLGPIEPPRVAAIADGGEVARTPAHTTDLSALPRVPMEANAGVAGASCRPETGSCGVQTLTPARRALERRLSGVPFSHRSASAAAADDDSHASVRNAYHGTTGRAELDVVPASAAMLPTMSVGGAPAAGHRESGGMTNLLQRDVVAAVRAQVLPTRRLLLPKGAFIDCTLETAIDSTLPGMTTCITAIDTFGADGKVVLLERGTKLVGETRGQVRHGAARVFVVWTEARTPTGVVVALDSPGTDELGRAGLPGKVERHFWDRFGAAILISMVDGATQAAVQSAGSSNAAVIYNPSSSRDILTEVLRGTMDIPPTVTKAQGERIQVLVARDLDFSTVYELRVHPPGAVSGS